MTTEYHSPRSAASADGAPPAVAAWLRVSSDGQTTGNQRLALRQAAKARGLRVVREFVLDGRSAYHGEHLAQLDDVISDARSGRFTHLLTVALDRLSRGGAEASLRACRQLEEAGVRVISLAEPWLEGSADTRDLLIAIAGDSARRESREKSERNRRSHARLRAAGQWPGGRPPLGYRRNDAGRLEIDPAERPLVELIFDLYTVRRLGIDRIRRELHARALPHPRTGSGRWSRNAVTTVLRQRGLAHGTHEPTGVPMPPIVPVGVWERAQSLLNDGNRRLRHTGSGGVWPLTGMRCAACASVFGTESGGARERVYFDRGRHRTSPHYERTGRVCRAVPRLPADEVERRVLAQLIDTFADPDNFIEAIDAAINDLTARAAELSRDTAPLETELARIEAARAKLADGWVAGALGESEVERRRSALDEREAALRTKLDALGPHLRGELDRTRRLLAGAHDWRAIARRRREDGLPMHAFRFSLRYAESGELTELRNAAELPTRMPADEDVPTVLADWLARLHADLYAHPDRIEVRGRITLDVEHERQPSHTGRGLR